MAGVRYRIRTTATLSEIDGVQVRIGANLYDPGTPERAHGFELERIVIE